MAFGYVQRRAALEEFRNCEILLVEDSPLDAELVMSSLEREKWACDIVWAHDGEEALDYLFRRGKHAARPDVAPLLVLLDLKMPRLSGIDVLREIKADDRTRRVPVVVMTSSNEDSDVTRAYDLGANSYVVKPFDFAALTEVMRSAGHYWLTVNRRTP
jgi:two-component system, response regulator